MRFSKSPLRALGILGLALLFAACSDDDPVLTAPEEQVEPPRVTDTFTGTFTQDESGEHPFTVSQRGTVELMLTELQPVPTLTVGMAFGSWDPMAEAPCSVIASDNRVVVGAILISTDVSPSEYCVVVADVGNVFPDATVTYTVEVLHP